MRIRLPLAKEPRDYNFISIDRYQLKELRNVAHAFDILTENLRRDDENSEEEYLFCAIDFVEWMTPDTIDRQLKIAKG